MVELLNQSQTPITFKTHGPDESDILGNKKQLPVKCETEGSQKQANPPELNLVQKESLPKQLVLFMIAAIILSCAITLVNYLNV